MENFTTIPADRQIIRGYNETFSFSLGFKNIDPKYDIFVPLNNGSNFNLTMYFASSSGQVAEGSVGAGTGTVCFGWKGGIGTASRILPAAQGGFTIGALVQSNFGSSRELLVSGVPVGRYLSPPANIADGASTQPDAPPFLASLILLPCPSNSVINCV